MVRRTNVKIFNDTARYIDRGGEEMDLFNLGTMAYNVWFLELKKDVGNVRRAEFILWLWLNLFMKRLKMEKNGL